MTEKLYDYDAYAKEFDGKVLECAEGKKGFEIILDKTLFFPEEGGQSPDKGSINGIKVIDVQIKDGIITHFLSEPVEPGTCVHGIIDWEHRFSNMQLHSGEHIFSGLVNSKYGFNNVGFHLSDNTATMDYDGKFTYEDALALEKEANKVIFANKRIIARYPDEKELNEINYRSKKEISGPVRIVTVEDTDVCACCAPHVRLTGEIGMFKIIGFENYKSGVRITYLCGFRALDYFNDCIENLNSISQTLSAKRGEEKDRAKSLLDDYKKISFENVALLQKLVEQRIEKEYSKKENGMLFLSENEASLMRFASTKMTSLYENTSFVLAGNDEKGYRFLIESNKTDLSKLLVLLKEKYNAKGGGKEKSIQGNVLITKNELEKYLDY